jgi:hypothetical protein
MVRRTLLVVTVTLPLCGCGWFGHKGDDPPPPDTQTSDETLKRDCANDQWKQQNLGLWYSVCRQPMKW